ncbi:MULTISPECIES: hypothetical protein [unclassified Staphylococcus]|uniref:hypothetical protein n=1 Tax=unclassified Staphylococcus TaxID=91994 RepID=UPI0021D232FD|nr:MULTISPECIES: hypothetical protein [unclassified Staphylococcus]UXR72697.1 hypothetical protein MUA88_00715 [Staphylococcus sp. IVB6240]UXR77323.1 hypothetical protein MUA74_01255 [Staphylococcus sp. IVB6233]UXR81490.1 hypothetical protein MUA65_00865 [Staphylococcus sp. IVB6218]
MSEYPAGVIPTVAVVGVPYALPSFSMFVKLSCEAAIVTLLFFGFSIVSVFGLSYDTVYWNVIFFPSLVTFNL